MKKLFIIKTGTTFPDTEERLGDFDRWTSAALGPIELELDKENIHSEKRIYH